MGKKVIVVDDSALLATMAKDGLTGAGYEVITAGDGQEGLDKIKKEKPDLIVLDVVMPNMDGYEVFKTLRKDPELDQIPVIMLTARSGMKDTFEVLDADAFIAKPVDIPVLIEKVNFILSKKVLLLTNDPYLLEKSMNLFQKLNYNLQVASNEEELINNSLAAKYNIVIIHLPYINKDPKELIAMLRRTKTKNAKIIAYSDARVKGTEQNDTVVIDQIKHQWLRAGVDAFFDSRISEGEFSSLIQKFSE